MGEEGSPNVSTCTNKEVAEGSMYRIGMNGGISQHTPSMRCMMREQIRKKETKNNKDNVITPYNE